MTEMAKTLGNIEMDEEEDPDANTTLYHVAVEVENPASDKAGAILASVAKLLRWRYDGELSTELLGDNLFISFIFDTDPLDPKEDLEEVVEVMAHSIWLANGEYCPLLIATGLATEGDPTVEVEMDEDAYETLMKEGS